MHDDGLVGDLLAGDCTFTAVLPASVQTHRRLVRYRINVADTLGKIARVPYLDDEQPNFAYFVYNGAPAWTGRNQPPSGAPTIFPASLMTTLPTYQLIANETDVTNSQYNSAYDTIRMWGTLVYDGKVYDHIEFHNKGSGFDLPVGEKQMAFPFRPRAGFRGARFVGPQIRTDVGHFHDARLRDSVEPVLPRLGGAGRGRLGARLRARWRASAGDAPPAFPRGR